jgi:hypothetical protein
MIHAPYELVLCAGSFVDEAPYAHRYDWTRVYHRSTRERREDYMRARDYFFRYDHGVTNVHPRSFLGRLLFGKLFGSSQLLWLAERLHPFLGRGSRRPDVTLDVFIPSSRVPRFMEWYGRAVSHFPMWCVPYRRVRDYEWLSPSFYGGLGDDLLLDLGIYGCKQPETGPDLYEAIEQELLAIGGMKTLISHNRFSERDFWRIWNKDNYDLAKAIGDPKNVFRDLYTKTCRAAQGLPG